MPENPQEFYSGIAAARIIGMTRANLTNAVKAGRLFPDALINTRIKAQPAFLRQTLEAPDPDTRPPKTKPQQFYATTGAIEFCGMSQVHFDRKRRAHPITPDALLHRNPDSAPQALYTRKTLSTWMQALVIPASPTPRPLSIYPLDQAALLLGIAPGEFEALLKAHPLPAEAMVIDPASPAWFEKTLKEYGRQFISEEDPS